MDIRCFIFNALAERCSVLWDRSGECVIVDPGYMSARERTELTDFIAAKGLTPVKILLTHAHFDHIIGLKDCALTYGIPVYMHPGDRQTLANAPDLARFFGLESIGTDVRTNDIAEGDTITFGESSLEVIHTPGHTPGGVCYLCLKEKLILTGDTLFKGAIGRTDLPGGDYDDLIGGILSKLMLLDGDIDVIPGHGDCTSIAEERQRNPFLQPFNEPYEEETDV